jgi:hypothetical protein
VQAFGDFCSMLERTPLVTPDMESWEAQMAEIKEAKAKAVAPEWPKELDAMVQSLFEELEAAELQRKAAALQAGASGDAATGGGAGAGSRGPRNAKERRAAAQAAEVEAKFGADEVERRAAALRGDGAGVSQFAARSTRLQSRLTKNDELHNTRSLDRAYADRLVLLVRHKDTGLWDLPSSLYSPQDELSQAALTDGPLIALGGEAALGSAVAHLGAPGATMSQQQTLADLLQLPAMPSAAWRGLMAVLGDDVRPWYVGTGPVAVHLERYSPEMQEERGCFGRKRFLFRADILDGRIELDESSGYDDYQWLTRREAEEIAFAEAHDTAAEHSFKKVLINAMGWTGQEFVHRAGVKPTPSGRPEEAVAAAAAAATQESEA